MLKKYLNYSTALQTFLHISLFIILCYTIALTLFLSMPPENLSLYTVSSSGILYLENVLCALSLTAAFSLLLKYLFG